MTILICIKYLLIVTSNLKVNNNSMFQDLETHFENTKHELQVTQEALAKFQSSQQVRFLGVLINVG